MAPCRKYNTDRETLENECVIDYYSGTGKGGQNRNRHYNCVRIHHRPSGIIVVGTEERSQRKNRELAFRRLIERLEELNYEKPRRVPTKVSTAAKRARVDEKSRAAVKKAKRRKVIRDDES